MTTASQSVGLPLAPAPSRLPPLTPVDLDALTAKQFIQTLLPQLKQPRPQLLVDCGTLHALRQLGISHVVSELLVLRQSGAQVWLRNVDSVLQQCLHMLHLNQLFLLAE